MNYSSAKEFADIIKKEFYEYEQEAEDRKLRHEVVKRQFEKMGIETPAGFQIEKEFNAINTRFQEVVDKIINRFYSIIPSDIKEKFEKHFYFTTIDNKSIRAHITRSSNKKFFGVFINSSLINLLTKIGKLDAALLNPDCIVYCNRFPESKPSLEDIKLMRNEMFEYFMTHKMSHGPFLVVEGAEANTHFAKLDIQEQFIIYHEIAHFLNADLFDNTCNRELISPFTNLHHQKEHFADLLAFALVLNTEKEKLTAAKEYNLFLITAIIHLFDIMYGLQGQEGETHPHPLNRMSVIIEGYFGTEIADIIEKTYYDREAWKELFSMQLELKYDIASLDKMLNKLMIEAFDEKNWN